jgi:Protein of unknown function (DUF429)
MFDAATPVRVQGVDFTSAPRRGKPITVARLAPIDRDRHRLMALEAFRDWPAFERFLARPGPSITAFDLPFGLPRALVESPEWPPDWPRDWLTSMRTFAAVDRTTLRTLFKRYCDARPVGAKFAHRASDGPAGSSPSMKWVNPPVAWMMHAGVHRLIDAHLSIPGLRDDPREVDGTRIALEGYPGFVARSITRASYKSDASARQTGARRAAREHIVAALEQGAHRWPIRVAFTVDDRRLLVDDGSADHLDAVLCAVQAAWAWQRRIEGDARFGLPPDIDPLEGWIVGVPRA